RPRRVAAAETRRQERRTGCNPPDKRGGANAPGEGAAYRTPRVPGPPPSPAANAGSSAFGKPKNMAFESMTKMPSRSLRVRTYRNPSRIERRLGRSAPGAAGKDGSSQMATNEAANVSMSSAKAPDSPTAAISSPPHAGPAL